MRLPTVTLSAALAALLPTAPQAVLPAAAGRQAPPRPDPAWLDELGLDERAWSRIVRLSPLGPPPPDPTNAVADDPRAQRLGQALFFDARLSANAAISCSTCHDPRRGFEDGQPVAKALGEGTRRAPTLLDVAHRRWFFWDGRADSLWSQALEPIENPIEMGSSRLAVAHHLHDDPDLRRAYEALFGALPPLEERARFPARGRPVPEEPGHADALAWRAMAPADRESVDRVFVNVGKSIAAYERQLESGPAPFDRFVAALAEGDRGAAQILDARARAGLALFVGRAGCVVCHSGPTFSDSEFHNTGVAPRPGTGELDSGRYGGLERLLASPFRASCEHSDAPTGEAARRLERLVTSSESWGEFKTPTLRGVARRGPYMHAGQFERLEDVLRFYSTLEGADVRSHHQERVLAPLELRTEELAQLSAFLESLGGPGPAAELMRPPPSPLLD